MMSTKKTLVFSYVLLGLGIIALGTLNFLLSRNEALLKEKCVQRYRSYQLVDELRQNLDDLTRFARAFVATGEPHYEKFYKDILAIQRGEKPRPKHYERIYWDLVSKNGEKPHLNAKRVALDVLMKDAQFSAEEIASLHKIQTASHELIQIDTMAMNAVKGVFRDDMGKFTRKGKSDEDLARRLVYNEQYYHYKTNVMQSLDDFFRLVDKRTLSVVRTYEQHSAYLLKVSQLLLISLVFFTIMIAIIVTRRILHSIGGEPSEIAYIAQKVAKGDFNVAIDMQSQTVTGAKASLLKMVMVLQQLFGELQTNLQRLAQGDSRVWFDMPLDGEFLPIQTALEDSTAKLNATTVENKRQSWLKSGQTQLNECLSGEQDIQPLAEKALNFLAPYLGVQVGAFYVVEQQNGDTYLRMIASHAMSHRRPDDMCFGLGEGLVGQAAYERKLFIIKQAPQSYVPIQSGLGEGQPRSILLCPLLFEEQLKGVIELASFKPFNSLQTDFMGQAANNIAIVLNVAESRAAMQRLLQQSQVQAKKLQEQQTVLEESNERLQQQSEELQAQQEELRQTNEELEEQGRLLHEKQSILEKKNKILNKIRQDIEIKAEELEIASQYKSEFLANMSHELRTPLNSMLILAQLLAENAENTLSEKQTEAAQTIYDSGSDLLNLINEILDLSKIEAGKVDIYAEEVFLSNITTNLQQKFQHVAQKNGVAFNLHVAQNVPKIIITDAQRLQQILTNLLSNAFKFTHEGSVTVNIRYLEEGESVQRNDLNPMQTLVFCVSDSGIGIPTTKQQQIFEAFQQADGTTNRKYGGTGLGLSISRQLAQLLGGEIQLRSTEARGSDFCLFLPERLHLTEKTQAVPTNSIATQVSNTSPPMPDIQEDNDIEQHIDDDRLNIQSDDKVLLIIEDDQDFASTIAELAHQKGFKCLIAYDGKSGLQLAVHFHPSAIMLDVGLPQLDGWSVMDRLKNNIETRHIPVHFLSGNDYQQQAYAQGAIGYALKPVNVDQLKATFESITQFIDRTVKQLLIAADNKQYAVISQLIEHNGLSITQVDTPEQILSTMNAQPVDCMILDIDFTNTAGIDFFEQLCHVEHSNSVPIIVYSTRNLTVNEESLLKRCASQLTIKPVHTPERLLDEATLFLHQVEAHLPAAQQAVLKMMHDKEAIFKGKKVMVVDDDMRNGYALSAVLEPKGVDVLLATNGENALNLLQQHRDVALVLMDIMMPEMDGYHAMRHIRAQPEFQRLPIIALTAKAMKDDRIKCIEAGANDYIAKPLDTDKLLSLMRVWLYR